MSGRSGFSQGFVTGGTWCTDYNMMIPTWPREESSTRILSVDRQGGGSGCNFAVDMRSLDPSIPVATIGLRGDDDDGDFLYEVAVSHGIDATRLQVVPNISTHRTMAFTAADTSRRTHIFNASSADLLTPDHFDFANLSGRMLHLGLPGTHARLDAPWGDDHSGWLTVLRRARSAGLATNMEVMTIPKDDLRRILSPCLPHLDYLVVNDFEIGALSGRDTLDEAGTTQLGEVELAAREIATRGTMSVVVVHFPKGAVAVTCDGLIVRHASVDFPADQVVGTNGAGDAFAAGFFCALASDQSLHGALALGHAAAAASLCALGTTDGVLPMYECLALAEQYGWRSMKAG